MVRSSQILMHACRALAALVIGVSFATAAVAQSPAPAVKLANPASQNCVAKGGQLVMQKNPRGQYGVCTFTDNMQCEEWAMMRGECPVGGIKVTGYVTPAARYCAITGGSYTVTGASNTPKERGNCAFPNGKTCTAAGYFSGACTRQPAAVKTAATGTGTAPSLPQRIQARFTCADGKSINATFINGKSSSVQLVFSDGRKMTLPQAMSADGGRYANKAETVVFWNKGNTAFVQENGKTTYADCATKS